MGSAPLVDADRTLYILVVWKTTRQDGDGNEVYELVGAGCLPGRCIATDGIQVNIY